VKLDLQLEVWSDLNTWTHVGRPDGWQQHMPMLPTGSVRYAGCTDQQPCYTRLWS